MRLMLLQEYKANVTGFKGSCKYAQGELLRQANEEMCTSFNDPGGYLGLMQVGCMVLCCSVPHCVPSTTWGAWGVPYSGNWSSVYWCGM
jgi:hypothetical protein